MKLKIIHLLIFTAVIALACYCRMDIEKRTNAYLKVKDRGHSMVNRGLFSNQVVTNMPGEVTTRTIGLWGSETIHKTVNLPTPFYLNQPSEAAKAD